jgi:hypothetical protein
VIASCAEIRTTLAGIMRLWRGDIAGFQAFDRSLEGFWRSYTAALLGAPAHALVLLANRGQAAAPIDSAHDLLVEAIAYAVTWLAYPLLMLFIADRLGRSSRFFDYMVPYNWATLAGLFVIGGAALMQVILPQFLAGVLTLVALAAVVHLLWFIAREGLQIGTGLAILIVIFDFSLTFFVSGIADALKD